MPNIKVRGEGWLTSFVTDRATGGEQVEKKRIKIRPYVPEISDIEHQSLRFTCYVIASKTKTVLVKL